MYFKIERNIKQEIESDKIKLYIVKKRATIVVVTLFFIPILIMFANYYTANNMLVHLFAFLFICIGIGIVRFMGPSIDDAKKNFKVLCAINDKSEFSSELILSNNYLSCKTLDSEDNFHWKEFRKFIEYDNYVYITSGKGFNSSFVIMKKELTAEEFDELMIFLAHTIKRFEN